MSLSVHCLLPCKAATQAFDIALLSASNRDATAPNRDDLYLADSARCSFEIPISLEHLRQWDQGYQGHWPTRRWVRRYTSSWRASVSIRLCGGPYQQSSRRAARVCADRQRDERRHGSALLAGTAERVEALHWRVWMRVRMGTGQRTSPQERGRARRPIGAIVPRRRRSTKSWRRTPGR